MPAVLVKNYGQPLSEAWACTLREYFMIVDLDMELTKESGGAWDREKLEGFEEHLRGLGVLE